MSHSVTQVVNAPLRSNDFYCEFDQSGAAVAGATAAVNTRWREDMTVPLIFPLLHPHAINHQRTYPRAFCTLPRFRSHTETKMATAQTQRSISATSQKNRGL